MCFELYYPILEFCISLWKKAVLEILQFICEPVKIFNLKIYFLGGR